MPLATSPLPSQVFNLIAEEIRSGALAVGSRFPTEPELCLQYGVSRTVIREAIAYLKADGLLDVQQGRGSFVLGHTKRTPFRFNTRPMGPEESIQQLAELRLSVEVAAGALAAARRTPAQLKTLQRCLKQMDAAVKAGVGGVQADLEFHQTIAEATGNEHYRAFMDYLRQHFLATIEAARANVSQAPVLPAQAQQEHVVIYEAIAARDGRAAQRAIETHIRNAIVRLTTSRMGQEISMPDA